MGGQLAKGRLKCQEGNLVNQSVQFMFNPTEYTITKTNAWNKQDSAGSNVSQWKFGGGEPRQLTLELLFDSAFGRKDVGSEDVRKATNQLFNFMMIDDELKGLDDEMGQPPKCCLIWAQDSKNQFDCYIASCTVKYLMFDGQTGVPVRATASLTLKEERDP